MPTTFDRLPIHQVDPLKDLRWTELAESHSASSVFHSVPWLEALRRTYGYEPVVFTTSPATAGLRNGLLCCRVHSWLTGRRIVSLPFSDHCEPLLDSVDEGEHLLRYACARLARENYKYLEVRSTDSTYLQTCSNVGLGIAKTYYLHVLDLRRGITQIFHSFAKDSIQRRIRRAENADLHYERGATARHLDEFYRLLIFTRARHSLPPQPYAWFENLVGCMGDALELRLAYHRSEAIAAVMTLRFRETVYYKYGCSDLRFKNLGATPFLLWNAIKESKVAGACQFDLGRSETDNSGLVAFKDHWTAGRSLLSYCRFPASDALAAREARNLRLAKRFFSWMPDTLLAETGRFIYRHIG